MTEIDSSLVSPVSMNTAHFQDVMLSADELRARHKLMVLDQLTKPTPEIEPHAIQRVFDKIVNLPDSEASESIQEMRTSSFPWERKLWAEYLLALRSMRREQAAYITERMSAVSETADPIERRALYIDAVSHSPAVSERVLRILDDKSSHSAHDSRLFTDQQIIKAAESPQAFEQALSQALLHSPGLVVSSLDLLGRLVDERQIRQTCDVVLEDERLSYDLVYVMPKVLAYYPDEERTSVIRKLAATSPLVKNIVMGELMTDDVQQLIGLEEQSVVARELFEDQNLLPNSIAARNGIKLGVWTAGQIEQRLLDVAGTDPMNIIGANMYEDVSPDVIAQVKEKVIEYLSSTDDLGFGAIDRTGLLTDEDIRQVLEAHIARNFEGTIRGSFSHIEKVFTTDEVIAMYAQYMDIPANRFKSPYIILASEHLPVEQRAAYLEELYAHDPEVFLRTNFNFYGLDAVIAEVGTDRYSEMIKGAFSKSNFSKVGPYVGGFAEYLGDRQSIKDFIAKGMKEDPILYMFQILSDGQIKEIEGLFSKKELEDMLDHSVEVLIENGNLFNNLVSIDEIGNVFGEQRLRQLVDRAVAVDPIASIDLMMRASYVYSPEEIERYIVDITSTDKGRIAYLSYLGWGHDRLKNIINPETVREIVLTTSHQYVERLMNAMDNLEAYFSKEEARQLVKGYAKSNPAYVLMYPEDFAKYGVETDSDEVIKAALSDTARMSVAGKYLKHTLQKAQRTESEPSKLRLLSDAADVYSSISVTMERGMFDELQAAQGRLKLSAEQERSLLESFVIVNGLGGVPGTESARSYEDIENMVTDAVLKKCGIEADDQKRARVRELLYTPNSIGLYVMQYQDSPEHMVVVESLLGSIADGSYEDWRFGGKVSQENLTALKAMKLLPEGLTIGQWELWRTETSSDFHEAFSLEASTAVNDIRAIIHDNAVELPEGSVIARADTRRAVEDIGKQIREFGQMVGMIQKELGELRKQPDQELASTQVDELELQLRQARRERTHLEIQQDVAILLGIEADALSSGVVSRDGKKGKPLVQVMQRLSKNLELEQTFITDRIQTVLDSYRLQTGEARSIAVTDTVDPRIGIEIGESPVGSCQSYRNGEYNEALLGYMDPNTKILLLRGDNGRPIARAIFRFLETDDHKPALHIETIYSAEASDAVARSMYRHALKKADSLGVNLYVSAYSQGADGNKVPFKKGIDMIQGSTESETQLQSGHSRAPLVYVDSASGPMKLGKYKIRDLVRLSKTGVATQ